MKALITGASSGIGKEMAYYLASKGCELILVGRDKKKLELLQQNLKVSSKVIVADLSDETKVKEVYIMTKNDDIDILNFVKNSNFYHHIEHYDSTNYLTHI